MIEITRMNEQLDPLEPVPMPRRLKVALIASSLVLIWSIALLIATWALERLGNLWGSKPPDVGGLATLLFGASSLALVMFSVLLAAAGFVGWESLKNTVKREIESGVRKRITELETELNGRVATILGFTVGSLHSNPESIEQSDTDKEYLTEAVYYCRVGYDKLKGLKGTSKYWSLNNLLYYQCLWGENLKPRQILEQAKILKAFGIAHDVPGYLLTYCRVISQLSRDPNDLKEAFSLAQELARHRSEPLTGLQRREAEFYVNALSNRLASSPET